MADPKYADLPGIDTSQPDVFETSDLPEDDQEFVPDELTSESVERIVVNPDSAYSRFKGKSLDASSLDFSDRIGANRKTGYDSTKTEYEMVGEGCGVIETPMQRYQRLQHEIRELAEDVDKIQSKAKQESKADKSPVVLSQQVHDLRNQLHDLHLEKILGSVPVLDLADPQAQLPKKLLSQLEGYKKVSDQNSSKTPTKNKTTQDGHILYELFYKPEQAKFGQVSKVADLEQRLARLEDAVGQNPEKLSVLRAETHSKNLVDAVAELQAKATVLDPIQLDHVDARMQNLLQRLNEIKQKKKSVEDAAKESRDDPEDETDDDDDDDNESEKEEGDDEKEEEAQQPNKEVAKKLSELYDMMERWDSVAETLPRIADRLASLKDLHEQALQFSQALSHLDTTQQQISSGLQSQESMLKKLQDSFSSNMAAIQGNCVSLDERIKKLK